MGKTAKLKAATGPRTREPGTGIKSIEVGLPLLNLLAEAESAQPLTRLAAASGMSPGRTHKYLTSLARLGFVQQDSRGGAYDLGPAAVALGTSALRRLDVMKLAESALDALRDQLGTTVSLTVWGSHGPTIVRWAEVRHFVSLSFRLGTVLPIVMSANGRLFAAYLDRRLTRDLIRDELAAPGGPAARAGIRTFTQVETLLDEVRRLGLSASEGLLNPDRATICAPVFDHTNSISASISVVGAPGELDVSPHGVPALMLREAATELSIRLGATPSLVRAEPAPPPRRASRRR